MAEVQKIYLEFLANFPVGLRPMISIGMAVLLVYSIIKVIKKDFLYIIGLVVLLPASKPMLQSVWQGVVDFIKFLLNNK
jgi:hypothetical protein